MCACAALYALIFTSFFALLFHCLAICADRSSPRPRENYPPFDGMRCNLTDRGFVRASFYPKLFFTHFHTRCLADRRSSQLENSPPFDGMRCNLRWLTEAVPLPNLHGSKLQLANTLGLLVHVLLHASCLVDHDWRLQYQYRLPTCSRFCQMYNTHITATGRSVLLLERKAVRWRHVIQPGQILGKIPSWVAPAREW